MFNEIEFRNRGKELFEKYGDTKSKYIGSNEDIEALEYYRKLQPLFNGVANDKEVTLDDIKEECIRQNPSHRVFLNKVMREGLIKNPYMLSQYVTLIALVKAFGASGSSSVKNRYGVTHPRLYDEVKTLGTKDFVRLNYIIATIKIN